MPTLTVYTSPNSRDSAATRRLLDQLPTKFPGRFAGLTYQPVSMTADPDAPAVLTALGYQGTAVVVVVRDGDQVVSSWSGYRPDLLRRAAAAVCEGRLGA